MSLDDRVAGVSCREVLAQLGDSQDGGLAADARAALEAHVGACANCAAFGGRRGTWTVRPSTVTGTRSGRVAFHCERRWRVLLREVLRFGTAMVPPQAARRTSPSQGSRPSSTTSQ